MKPYLTSVFDISAGNRNYNALQVDLSKRVTGDYSSVPLHLVQSMDMGTALTSHRRQQAA